VLVTVEDGDALGVGETEPTDAVALGDAVTVAVATGWGAALPPQAARATAVAAKATVARNDRVRLDDRRTPALVLDVLMSTPSSLARRARRPKVRCGTW
jgi:hypothetical protein